MSNEEVQPTEVTEPAAAPAPAEETVEPRVPAPPIESRFLFVDVAALRATQWRRGATPRLGEHWDPSLGPRPTKPERIAMAEVRLGLVDWYLPEFHVVVDNR
jgi:DNA-directed RNA polymerase subunit K/omega